MKRDNLYRPFQLAGAAPNLSMGDLSSDDYAPCPQQAFLISSEICIIDILAKLTNGIHTHVHKHM